MSRIDLIATWLNEIQPQLARSVYPREVSGVAAAFDAKTQQSSFEFDVPPRVLFVADKMSLALVNSYHHLPLLLLTNEEQNAVSKTLEAQKDKPGFYNGDHIIITAAIYDLSLNTLYLEARKVDYAFLLTLRNKSFPQDSNLYRMRFFQTGVLCPLITTDDSLVLMQRTQLGLFSQVGGFLEPIDGEINFPDGTDLVSRTAAKEIEEELALNARTGQQRFSFDYPQISAVSIRMTDQHYVSAIEFIAPTRVTIKADSLQWDIKNNSAKDAKEHTGTSVVVPLASEKREELLKIALMGPTVLLGQPLFLPMLVSACRIVNSANFLPRSVPMHSTMAIPVSALFPRPQIGFTHFSVDAELAQLITDDLSKAVLTQLSWLQTNSISTPESNVRMSVDTLNIEIKRSLNRLHCFKLLTAGDESAYQKFIEKQPVNAKLTRRCFNILSALINGLSDEAKQCIEASCFMSMSDTAKRLAEQYHICTPDSEIFLSQTMRTCPHIYPATERLSTNAKMLLPSVYLMNTHARHMLYTEGGNNMFEHLRRSILRREISKADFESWFARWIINIAGFRGHEESTGSLYLTEHTADCLLALKLELDKLFLNPEHDVLAEYLNVRAEKLGLGNNIYLAHIACMMRLRTHADAAELAQWFHSLDRRTQNELERQYHLARHNMRLTPTYAPAVLDNLRALGCSIADTAAIYMHIEMHIFMLRHEIKTSVPICLRSIAQKENLQQVIEHYRSYGALPALHFSENGNLEITTRMLGPTFT